MSAPDERVREILSHLIADAVDEREPARIAALHELRGLVNDIVRQVTISQHAADVTSIAHMWAEARRARLSLGPVRLEPCITEPNEGTCVDVLRYGTLISPCEACEVTLERMGEKKRRTAKLSGLSARLERACLGPRPKKEDPTC